MAASIFPHFEVEHTFLISNNLVQFPYAYFADYGMSGSCGQIQIAWCSSESLPRCGSQAHCIHDEGVCWLREPYTTCPSFTLHPHSVNASSPLVRILHLLPSMEQSHKPSRLYLFNCIQLLHSCVFQWYHKVIKFPCLLVIAEEDLDGQPGVTANLEALRQRVDDLDLFVGQLPAVKLEVALDALSRDRLGDDTGTALQTPNKQDLLDGLALLLGELLELLVLVEGRVGGTKAGVGGGVDALLLEVVEKLGSVYRQDFACNPTAFCTYEGLLG